jgi:hypothetical protein
MHETIQEQRDPKGRFASGNSVATGSTRYSMAKAPGLAGKSVAILAKVDQGKITPADGAALLSALASCVHNHELCELACRVTALECRA